MGSIARMWDSGGETEKPSGRRCGSVYAALGLSVSSTEVRAAKLRRDGTIAQRRFPIEAAGAATASASTLPGTLANAILAMHVSSRTFREIVVACDTDSLHEAVSEGIRNSGYHGAHIVPTATAQWHGFLTQSPELTERLVGSALLVDGDGAHASVSLVDSVSGEMLLQVRGPAADSAQIERLLAGMSSHLALSEDLGLEVVWVSSPAGPLARRAQSIFATSTVSSADPRGLAALGALHLAQQAGLPTVSVASRRGVSFHEGRKVYIAAAVAAVAVAIAAVYVGLVYNARPDVSVESFATASPTTAVEPPQEPVAAAPTTPEPSPTTALTFNYVAPTTPPPPVPTSEPAVAPALAEAPPTTTVSIEREPTVEAIPTSAEPTAAAGFAPPEPPPVPAPPTSSIPASAPLSEPPRNLAPSTTATTTAPPTTTATGDPRPTRTPPPPTGGGNEVEVVDLIAEFLRSANGR
jgi:hypothetical protein